MADKKKKDVITTRKPVILKSDRDTTKDPPKEKVEKEKPTIILKTREQSAPKEERSQSPKPQTSDATPYPSKIAQNDHKDKKEKPIPPLKEFPEAMKLLNENLEFNTQPLQYLSDSNSNYLVVGIIGTQGVGKSLILNLIAQRNHSPDLCEKILRSSEVQTSDVATIEEQVENLDLSSASEGSVNKKNDFVFKMQDMDHIERGVHCTKGIDMYVTEDRMILLDCQPLCAPSLLEEAGGAVTSRSASFAALDCLQLAAFLMSVCHVLIAVQDWFTDYNFIRYIQAAEMLRPSLGPAGAAGPEGAEGSERGGPPPHLLLLQNRCRLEDYTPAAVRTMQDFYRKAFKTSSLQLTSGMYMYSDSNRNGVDLDSVCKGYCVDTCGPPLNLFLLPEICSDHEEPVTYRGHPPLEQLARRLRWAVAGARGGPPDGAERAWLQLCARAWDAVRKCSFFVEYERFLP